jgi:cytochrome c553
MRHALFAALAASAALSIAAPAASAVEGNAEEGRVKAYTCAGCHGIEGYRNAYPSYRVPKIYGQHYDYLVAALNAYRSGERSHPTMRAQGESLTEQDIADLSRFLAGAPAPAAQ